MFYRLYMKHNICTRVGKFAVFSLFFGLFAFPNFAQSQSNQRYSETEKAGFAFYALSQGTPDFASWVKSTTAYQKAIPAERVQMLQRQTLRLQQEFLNFTPEDSIIHVTTKATIHYGRNIRDKSDKNDNKIVIHFSDKNGQPYFPFPMGESWVAAVASGLQNQKTIEMDEDEYKTIRSVVSRGKKLNYRAVADIELYLRPVSVDAKKPHNLDGVEVWLLMCDVLSLQIWKPGHTALIWKYEAPDYISNRRSEVLGLFGR